MENTLGLKIGDKALRRDENHPEGWQEFTVNESYLWLIEEFPEDYRLLPGWCGGYVKCDICNHEWLAVYPDDLDKLQCPNCRQIAHFEELGV